jgi:hypothetical protein
MTISPPPFVNYPNQLTSFPTRTGVTPPEGERMIQVEIDWGSMGGSQNCVFVNLQNNAVMNFSQIVSFSVDNSACGGDVQFIFPENSETLEIPAYIPKAIAEVFTSQTQFYVKGQGVIAGDITRFTILNYLPPPVVVPTSQEQNTAVVSNISINAGGSGSTQIVPLGVNGTVEAISVFSNIGAGAASFVEAGWAIEDGETSPKILAGGTSGGTAGGTVGAQVYGLSNLSIRFVNGLVFDWTVLSGAATSGGFTVNVYYRTP